MAYQPKSYRKFLAGTVTAAVVASAVTPVAAADKTFPDVENLDQETKEAIYALVDAGTITGYEDGTFKPFNDINRGQVAKMIVRHLGLELPEESAGVFADLSADSEFVLYAEALYNAGIISGTPQEDGTRTYGAGQPLTREQMAKILVNALDLVGTGEEVEVKDLNEAAADQREYIQTLAQLGLTSLPNGEFNPKDAVKRSQLALFLYRASQLEVEDISVSAVGAKKLEVKFNAPVDTNKAQITLKKGSINVNVSKVTFADDKKSAIVETTTKLTEGEYTVSVTGVTAEALTSSVTVQNERIQKIEFLSDVATISASDSTRATVAYKVYNQYEEDVTKSATSLVLTTTAADSVNTGYNAANGIITLDNGSTDYKVGDKVTISLLDAATGAFKSATVTVSAKAQTSDIEITGLYHADGKVLTADTAVGDVPSFKLVVDAKDQYGKTIVPSASDVVVTSSNPSVVDVNVAQFTTAQINGETKVVLPLVAPSTMRAGTATITIISKTTGDIAKFDVVVKAGVKADGITLQAPELVVADETVKVPFTVTDLEGNEITDETTLETSGKGVTFTTPTGISLDFVQNYLTGKAELQLSVASSVAPGKYTIIAQTANAKTTTLVVDVKEKAVPTVIVGLDSSVATSIVKGEQLVISEDKVLVQDQYGRTMGLDSLLGTTSGEYNLVLSEPTASGKVTIDTDTVSADNGALQVTGDVKGSTTLQLKLQKHNGTTFVDVPNSEFAFSSSVVEKADIVSYQIAEVGNIYDDAGTAYKRSLTVQGVLSNGSKVVVPSSWYTVSTNNSKLTYNAGQLDANGVVGGDNKDVTVKVDVIVDAHNAPVFLTKDVVVTKAAPQVSSTVVSNRVQNGAVTFTVSDVNAATFAVAFQDLFTFTDQYGESYSNDGATLTFTNLVNSDGDNTVISVSSGNGTTAADIDNAEAGDSFNVTIREFGYTNTIKVIVTP
ncbi:S-layer homology domain-containing protein [Bacillus litorisediminis]|uniref:S-layer homology domain-containing protein n=1 Tax=Bacillus litorisediminis TaxID=2922713 RepID=UPI001FAFEF4A|nr:S-layer homology domain-containing protein [Bacillus litorisediminis]